MSATSVVVAANMGAVAAIAAWFVLTRRSASSDVGVLICIAGGISYAIEVKKAKAMAKQQAIELAEPRS